MHRFYVPGFPDSGEIALPAEEAQHLARVLRLRAGDRVGVFDGRGREAVARVASVSLGAAAVDVLEPGIAARESAVRITLAQALLKSDKMERVMRDAVMMGAAVLQPVTTRRTDVPAAALDSGTRQRRWERTVVAAVKQCGRAVVPPVLPVMTLDALLQRPDGEVLMFVEPDAGADAGIDRLEGPPPARAVVVIGPEGGWEQDEIALARSRGARLVSLGGMVLRADAAGMAALSILRYVWRDL